MVWSWLLALEAEVACAGDAWCGAAERCWGWLHTTRGGQRSRAWSLCMSHESGGGGGCAGDVPGILGLGATGLLGEWGSEARAAHEPISATVRCSPPHDDPSRRPRTLGDDCPASSSAKAIASSRAMAARGMVRHASRCSRAGVGRTPSKPGADPERAELVRTQLPGRHAAPRGGGHGRARWRCSARGAVVRCCGAGGCGGGGEAAGRRGGHRGTRRTSSERCTGASRPASSGNQIRGV